jgi:hypothetical protein
MTRQRGRHGARGGELAAAHERGDPIRGSSPAALGREMRRAAMGEGGDMRRSMGERIDAAHFSAARLHGLRERLGGFVG